MKRFLMMDRSNTDRLTTEQNTRTEAEKHFIINMAIILMLSKLLMTWAEL